MKHEKRRDGSSILELYVCKPVDIINPSNYSELKAISLDHLNTPALLKRLGTFS